MIDERKYAGAISTYTDRFYPFIPWLRLNGIRYKLKADDYDGLLILIYKGETKREKQLISQYLNHEFYKIRKKYFGI